MGKALVTKEVVFKIAKQLIEQGLYPTQNKVREILGHGSMRDIGFYLREWKQKCFAANKAIPVLQEELTSATLELDDLEKGNKKFAKIQTELQQQIKKLTTNLKETEQQANKWQYQNEVLQVDLNAAIAEIKTLTEQYNHCQNSLAEKDHTIQLILQDKNQLITSLRQELKETTERAIVEARDDNHKHHDAMLKIQLENMNLQIELKNFTQKIREQDDQLLNLKLSIAPLKQTLKEKEDIINTYVTAEELNAYVRNCCK